MGFGRGPLSLPGSVEAIESLFVPFVCRNNVGGKEREILERFDEPAWNNPVVRFLDANGKDVAPRAPRAWTESAFLDATAGALARFGSTEPTWLADLRLELSGAPRERTILAMHCFWEGQAKLGLLPGVLDVRPAHAGGREVCEVEWSPERTKLGRLVRAALDAGAAERVLVRKDAERERIEAIAPRRADVFGGDLRAADTSDDLRALKRDRAAWLLPLTRAQRVRANTALALHGSLERAGLSPRLAVLHAEIARSLARDAHAFDGFDAPEGMRELGAHEDRVRARLAQR